MENKLKVQIYPNRKEMGEAAAALVAKSIRELLAEKEVVNIIFAAAPSQNEFLEALATHEVDWARISGFHMDEYIGLDDQAPQGFGNFLRERIFGKLPFRSVIYLNGNAANIEEECQRYSHALAENPTDIVCMGIGENGHIAFNDPPVADFEDKEIVKIVELDLACRQQQVNDGCFAGLQEVPTHALTLTIPALLRAPQIFCIVPGRSKANAVYNTLHKPQLHQYPSTILRSHPNAILFLDKDSIIELHK